MSIKFNSFDYEIFNVLYLIINIFHIQIFNSLRTFRGSFLINLLHFLARSVRDD